MYAIDVKLSEAHTVNVVRRGVHIFVKICAPAEFNPDVLHGARATLHRNDMFACVEIPGILVRAVQTKRLVLFTRNRRLIQVHRQSVIPGSVPKLREYIFRFATEVPNVDPASIDTVTLLLPHGETRAFSNAAFTPGV